MFYCSSRASSVADLSKDCSSSSANSDFDKLPPSPSDQPTSFAPKVRSLATCIYPSLRAVASAPPEEPLDPGDAQELEEEAAAYLRVRARGLSGHETSCLRSFLAP